ncbi:MAG: PAC2 family protein [Acidilobaceae archaeon]|nr:PAC2 family protein [Acidilobaceae archaeon]MCX8165778.1 PAC2 family protein [Acidilobaceae archaeon]MDW7974203.1 PAC2 family protein [Sulfolobales archaeon]
MIVYEEEIGDFVFSEYSHITRPRFLIVGLPDVGLVGEIAVQHIVRSLGLSFKAGVDSYSLLPPVAVARRGEVLSPIRVYGDEDGKVVALLTDIALNPRSIVPLSLAIVEYARLKGVEYVLGLTGAVNPERAEMERPGVHWVASTSEASRIVAEIPEIKRVEEGYIVGPYATLLKESAKRRVNTVVLMADSFLDIPDPEAAAVVVRAVSQIISREIPVEKLLEEGELIKIRLKELMKDMKSTLARMGKGYELRSPMIY